MSKDVRVMMDAIMHLWNTGDESTAAQFYHPDCIRKAPNQANSLKGMGEIRGYVHALRDAFPDANLSMDEVVEGPDCYVVRWTFTGTQRGMYNGLPPTNKHLSATGVTWVRMRDGLVVEEEAFFDNLQVLQTLGVIPPAASAAQP